MMSHSINRRPGPAYLPQTLLLAFMMVCFAISLIVPPFQAPDEPAHIQRAFMLADGQIVLHSVNGSPSGGMVDQGLLDYINAFAPVVGHPERKVTQSDLQAAQKIHWADKGAFVNPTGTAYYFPALYLPQAIALRLGMTMQLSVGQSYALARYFTLASCLLILALAFRIYRVPLFVLGVLVLPMNLFLFSTAVLDGMATAVSVLVLASFMRSITDREQTSPTVLLLLVVSTVLVTACRANMLPFLLLPFVVAWLIRDRRLMVYAAAGAGFVLLWTLYTVKFTVYPHDSRNIDHAARLFFYVIHPWEFSRILFATLTDVGRTTFYTQSFLGNLGALDTPLPPKVYWLLGTLLGALFLTSLSPACTRMKKHRLLLLICAVGAVLLTFLALLVQWTIEPATTIDGVQGRYFTIPVMVVAYAMLATSLPASIVLQRLRFGLAAALLAIGTYYSIQLLVARYYMNADRAAVIEVALHPSLPLLKSRPIVIHFSADQLADPIALTRIDLRFGTYVTTHTGNAALHLWTTQGKSITIPFELSSLIDNAYRRFDLDGQRYVGGEIISQGGEGVSLYEESSSGNKAIADCMAIYSDTQKIQPPSACPAN